MDLDEVIEQYHHALDEFREEILSRSSSYPLIAAT